MTETTIYAPVGQPYQVMFDDDRDASAGSYIVIYGAPPTLVDRYHDADDAIREAARLNAEAQRSQTSLF